MYRKSNESPLTPEKFELPVSVKLSPDNRWVIMAELIPWSDNDRRIGGKLLRNNGCASKTFSDGIVRINY